MSEPQEQQPDSATPKTHPRRSKWLIGLVAALAVAVCVQGAYLWEMHGKMDKALATANADEGWTVIPRPDESSSAQSGTSQSNTQTPQIPNPFLQPYNPNTWDPFKEMERMRSQMDQMFNQAFGRFQESPHFGNLAGEATFNPNFDLTEEPNQYVIKMDIPGSDEHNINVSIEGQTLTVSGTRTNAQEQKKGGKVLLQERTVGQFERSVKLPDAVDDSGMKTSYKNGVFTITLPKLHPSDNTPSESVRMQ